MRQIFNSAIIRFAGVWLAFAVVVCGSGVACASEAGRFQVVAGKDESSYLVDTTTGSVWVLTYRTLVTGREPIAIPYKFIKITPKDQGYLVENTSQMAPIVEKGGEGDKADGGK